MGKNFRDTLNEQLKDPEFKAEWDALEPERQSVRNHRDDSKNSGLPLGEGSTGEARDE